MWGLTFNKLSCVCNVIYTMSGKSPGLFHLVAINKQRKAYPLVSTTVCHGNVSLGKEHVVVRAAALPFDGNDGSRPFQIDHWEECLFSFKQYFTVHWCILFKNKGYIFQCFILCLVASIGIWTSIFLFSWLNCTVWNWKTNSACLMISSWQWCFLLCGLV